MIKYLFSVSDSPFYAVLIGLSLTMIVTAQLFDRFDISAGWAMLTIFVLYTWIKDLATHDFIDEMTTDLSYWSGDLNDLLD
jgi:hypothetical protein